MAKGGTEAMVRAMAAHESSAEVQEAGCGALGDVALWASGMGSHVREADAVTLVKKALSTFPYHWGLQARSGRVLMKLGVRSVFHFW